MRRILLSAFAAIVIASSAYAKTVAVAPCEDPALAAPELTSALVEGAMDGLFDAGLVATDAPTLALDLAAWRKSLPNLAEAKEGRVDYILEVFVAYGPSTIQGKAVLPVALEYSLFRVSDGKRLFAGGSALPADSPETLGKINEILHSLGIEAAKRAIAAIGEDSGAAASRLSLVGKGSMPIWEGIYE
jgi:hypothetical protein